MSVLANRTIQVLDSHILMSFLVTSFGEVFLQDAQNQVSSVAIMYACESSLMFAWEFSQRFFINKVCTVTQGRDERVIREAMNAIEERFESIFLNFFYCVGWLSAFFLASNASNNNNTMSKCSLWFIKLMTVFSNALIASRDALMLQYVSILCIFNT